MTRNVNDISEADFNSNTGTAEAGYQPSSTSQKIYTQSEINPLAALADLGTATASGNASTGNIADVLKVFTEVQARTANSPSALKVSLLPIEDSSLNISSIVQYVIVDGTLFYAIFLLEALSKPLPNKLLQVPGGKQIEVDRDASHYWDPFMVSKTEQILAATSNIALNLTSVAAIVVGRHTNLTIADKLAPYYDHGIAAITAHLRVKNGGSTSGLSAKLLSHQQLELTAKYDVTPGDTYLSTTGQPISADFNVVLYVRSANKNAAASSVHNNQGDIGLTSLMGYLDFMRRVPEGTMAGAWGGYNRPVPGYDPVVVITQNTSLGVSSQSNDDLLTQLLALPTLLPLIDPQHNKWSTIFEPFVGDSGNKPSIGLLALEHNLYPGTPHKPEVIKVVSGTEHVSGTDKLTAQQVIQAYINPTIIIAQDILHGGPLEWVQLMLANATPGSSYEEVIIDELDKFSDGQFSKMWGPLNQPILSAPSTWIHAGYYPDPAGKNRDIRSINYLALLESTGGDPNVFDPFAAGFLPGTDQPALMDQKRKLLLQVVPQITFTGMYTRIFYNNAFINTIDALLHNVGLQITVEGLVDLYGGNQVRRSFNSEFLSPIQTHGTFSTNFRTYNQAGTSSTRYQPSAGLGQYRK